MWVTEPNYPIRPAHPSFIPPDKAIFTYQLTLRPGHGPDRPVLLQTGMGIVKPRQGCMQSCRREDLHLLAPARRGEERAQRFSCTPEHVKMAKSTLADPA